MKRVFFSIIIVLLLISTGNVPATTIPLKINDTVTFIFLKNDSGQLVPNGTGFFVGVENENDTNTSYIYLVTAKHVLLDDKTNSLFNSVYVRLNKKNGDAQFLEIPLCGLNARKVYSHKDSSVDIALILGSPDPNIFDYEYIPVDMITTKEVFKESRIREGDDVFFIGLFTPYYGNQRNYPITRFGRVALITDEKIPWNDKKDEAPKMLDLYLVESQSFGGNSGSPVFFQLNPTRELDTIVIGSRLLLAGVMKGCYLDAKEIQVAETSKIPISLENVGIAAVVPAYRLYELLFSDELKKTRQEKKAK